MFDGYLAVNGTEVLNAARISAYIKALSPGLQVKCDPAGLAAGLGHGAYLTPALDGAPWYTAQRASAADFLGLFPVKMEGAEGSTRKVPVTELAGHGSVHTNPRYGSREIRFVVMAVALNEAAMNEGLAWLSDTLAADPCGGDTGFGCTGRDVGVYAAKPTTTDEAALHARTFHMCEVIDAPKVTERKLSPTGTLLWKVEFVISAGRPWAFTTLTRVAALNMDTAVNFVDPAGQDCSVASRAYDDFIEDPYFTAIAKPPRPPVILPPNLLAITSWRRLTAAIPTTITSRWGRTVPVVHISTGATAAQQIRLRFYRGGAALDSCDFDGEFLISYLPAYSVLTLDGIRQQATVQTPDGRTVPAGHLLFGSGGRPFVWPEMGCQNTYTMTADLMPGQTEVAVLLDTAVRE